MFCKNMVFIFIYLFLFLELYILALSFLHIVDQALEIGLNIKWCCLIPEAYSETSQTSNMGFFGENSLRLINFCSP